MNDNDNDARMREAALANLSALGATDLTAQTTAVTAALHLFTALGCIVLGMPEAAAGSARNGLDALERWARGELIEPQKGPDA